MAKTIVLFNPSSAGGRAADRRRALEAALQKAGVVCEFVTTQSGSHLRRLAREAGRYFGVIAGAGGDSTFSVIAAEIMASQSGSALAMIPLGSSNDIPRAFGLGTLDRAVAALAKVSTRNVDLGIVREGGRTLGWFLGQANLGLGAFVNRRMVETARRRPRLARCQALAGFLAVRETLRSGDVPLSLTIEGESGATSGAWMSAVFSNTRYWSTGREISPGARPDDGRLSACLIGPCSLGRLAKIHRAAGRGLHGRFREVRFLEGPEFRIRSEKPFEIQADGEILGSNDRTEFSDIEIAVAPRILTMVV